MNRANFRQTAVEVGVGLAAAAALTYVGVNQMEAANAHVRSEASSCRPYAEQHLGKVVFSGDMPEHCGRSNYAGMVRFAAMDREDANGETGDKDHAYFVPFTVETYNHKVDLATEVPGILEVGMMGVGGFVAGLVGVEVTRAIRDRKTAHPSML